jgi:hypothetical protein
MYAITARSFNCHCTIQDPVNSHDPQFTFFMEHLTEGVAHAGNKIQEYIQEWNKKEHSYVA